MGNLKILQVNQHNIRLDVYLATQLNQLSRSHLQTLIKNGSVLVDGVAVKPSYILNDGEKISIEVDEPKPLLVEAEDIELDIYYEDSDIIVVNKPQGIVVHPAAGHHNGTLVNALLHHCSDLSGINGVIRPGIVHRIDKDTSGLLVVAKNDLAHLGLVKQWRGHQIKRVYHGIVQGVISENAGIIEAAIGRHPRQRKKMTVDPNKGKMAITHYKVLERFAKYTFIECELKTGRTHQIRVHMSHLGHPLVGDPLYGSRKQQFNLDGQVLHASTIGFNHPINGQYLEFTSPLPDNFQQLLAQLREE